MDPIKDKVSLCINWFGEPSISGKPKYNTFTHNVPYACCYLGEKENKIHQTWSY